MKLPKAALFLLLTAVALLAACANPGSGPDGGPYDETPPRIVGMSPALGTTNATEKKVSIFFDELIKVENVSEKVTISPPQTNAPEIKTSGRRISVSLSDTLQPQTTYTIDFSDAIEDANEGNPLGNFTYFFSTGATIDTMEIAGTVLAAENLEPVKGILVGLHADLADSAFTSRPFSRVARTDSRGRFSIKGVKQGTYRVYALKDMDGDFRLTRGEMLAAMSESVTTSSYPDLRYDTAWHDSLRYDSIVPVRYTHYLPDNLILRAYTPASSERHFLKAQRDVPEWFRTYFTAPSTVCPRIKGLNFSADSLLISQASPGFDTITYWLRDITIPQVDTLQFVYTYDAYDDSLSTNVMQTDTLQLVPRQTMARRLKQQAEELAKFEKQREKRHRRGDYSQETPPTTPLQVKSTIASGASPMQNPLLEFSEPVVRIDTAAIHLTLIESDSIQTPAAFLLRPSPGVCTSVSVVGEWRYGQRYRLDVDSAAITGLTGLVNAAVKYDLRFGKEENFGSLFLTLTDADTTATVQLLQSDTKVVRQERARNGRIDFFYLKPGTYYLRCFYDRNLNGRWDTGNFSQALQPEEVFYFPQKIEVRANWDINQTWSPAALPLTQQKPAEITKQKADKKKTVKSRNAERERNRR